MSKLNVYDVVSVMRLKAYGYDPDGLFEFNPRELPSSEEISKQAERAGVKVGEVRYGVLDTGKPILEDKPRSLIGFVSGLEREGWVIVAVHKRQEPKPNKPGEVRKVAEMILVKGGERRPLLTDESIERGREFFDACWGGVTVWQNMKLRRPNDVPNLTVNLSGRMTTPRPEMEKLQLDFVRTPESVPA